MSRGVQSFVFFFFFSFKVPFVDGFELLFTNVAFFFFYSLGWVTWILLFACFAFSSLVITSLL